MAGVSGTEMVDSMWRSVTAALGHTANRFISSRRDARPILAKLAVLRLIGLLR